MNVPSQAKKAPLWLKVIVVGVIGLVFAPIAYYTVVGLFGLMLTGLLALVAIFGGPVLAEKMANWKMMGLTNEWAKNPIPTLQRQYVEKVAKLAESLEALKLFIGKVRSYEAQVRNYKTNFPKNIEKHKLYQHQYDQFFSLQQIKERKYKEAEAAVTKFGEIIQEAEAEWGMAMAAKDVNLAADFNNDPMELLKARTALTSVQDAMNASLAELDVALLEEPTFEGMVYENTAVPLKITQQKEMNR